MMLRTLLALAIILASTLCAAAATCKTAREKDGRYWSYRMIDGKRCWYAGPKGVSKRALHWRIAARVPRARILKPERPRPVKAAPTANDDDDESLMDTVWPPMPADTFMDRWYGSQGRGD